MAKTTYKRIEAAAKFVQIVEFLHQQTGPVSAGRIAEEVGLPLGTVQCHLATALDAKWLRQVGGEYESGPRISGMYAAYVMGLEVKRDGLTRELETLKIED